MDNTTIMDTIMISFLLRPKIDIALHCYDKLFITLMINTFVDP
jgi:hypothetical protein